MNADNLKNLKQFMGTDSYHRNPIGCLLYTDDVQFLAENAGAYWLIDAIASYQPKLKTAALREFQFWKLVVIGALGILTCREESDCEPVVTEKIEYTDFSLPKIELWVEGGVLLLPSEH